MGWQDAAIVEAPAPAPAWQSAQLFEPDTTALRRYFEPLAPRAATSFVDYIDAGFQQSVTGLAKRGRVPDVALDANTPWYGRLASSIAGIVGDSPAMLPGFVGGAAAGGTVGSAIPVIGTAAGGTVGGFAGAAALPAGLRAAMMEMYTKGDVTSSTDFLERALHVAWETTKGGLIGAATGGAGVAAKAVIPAAAGTLAGTVGVTSAEIATLATVGKALEGKLPEPTDFLDAAVLIGGVKGSAAVAGKLRSIYAATGKVPAQVVADAASNAELATELKSPGTEIPQAYAADAAEQAARAIVPGEKAANVAQSPFAEVTQAKGEPTAPTHVNYNFLNSSDDAAAALSRLSSVYEQDIQTQRRGTVSWDETSNEAAKILSDTLAGADPRLLLPREPGTAAGAAEILARKQLTIGAAEDMATRARDFLARGTDASPEDAVAFIASIERAAMIQSEFLGARAEVGRAMNILKSTAADADRVKQIQSVIDQYGGNPQRLAQMLSDIDTAAGALKFAKDAVKATTWQKVVEAWKAAILSGPITHIANILGNGTFAVLRAPIDATAAGFGLLRSGPDRVTPMEPLARMYGLLQGTVDGLKVAGAVMKTGEQPGKSEQFRKAIEGTKGEIIRLPFRALSAEDAIFSTMNERGEAHALAMRQATGEGFNPLTREFRERVAQLVQEPTPEMAKAIEAAGKRLTFNTELGDKGQAVQDFVRKWHLEFVVPFIRTPGNIANELARMTPFAPFVKEWREAIAKGGAERDKAIAELVVGSGIMSAVFAYALAGRITGAGEPDPGKRRVQQAAGIQPYSIKIGDTWYNYQRLQPLGTLIGIAADVAEAWDHLTDDEADQVPKMLSVAFANAVTSQTFLQGFTNLVNAMSDPSRFGPKLVQSYAGSVVPAIVAQPTQMTDATTREVNSIVDAIKARIPGLRETLLPKRDIFGEPIQTKERLGAVSPVTETQESTDKVRTEAARLGLAAADAPKKVHVGRGTGKLGDTDITPEQRDKFADVSGHLAHDVLTQLVNSPRWDSLPDLVQKRAYAKAFLEAHRAGAAAALPPALRVGIAQEISEKVATELQPND